MWPSTMPYVDCRHCCYCRRWTNVLPLLPNILNFHSSVQKFLCFSCIVESVCLVTMWKVWHSGCSSSANSWPPLYAQYMGSTGFCQFWADGAAGHLPISRRIIFFICCAVSLADHHMYLTVACFCVLFQKSMKSTSWNTSTEIFIWERPCWCNMPIMCLVAGLSLVFIYIFQSILIVYSIFYTPA